MPVKVLFDDGVNMAIQSDLQAGDKVIIDGQLRVLPGGKVSVAHARRQRRDARRPRRKGGARQARAGKRPQGGGMATAFEGG